MTVDVTTEVVIDRPVDQVASYAANPDNAPEWYSNIESVNWETPPPLVEGSRVAFVARFLGRRLEYTYSMSHYEPSSQLVMTTEQGPFPMETTYTWTDAGDNATRMTLRNRGQPSGFSRFTGPMMVSAMRRANEKDLANLRSILEKRAH